MKPTFPEIASLIVFSTLTVATFNNGCRLSKLEKQTLTGQARIVNEALLSESNRLSNIYGAMNAYFSAQNGLNSAFHKNIMDLAFQANTQMTNVVLLNQRLQYPNRVYDIPVTPLEK